MLVVADASPLIFLGRLGQLDLLRNLYDRILVPEAVLREATRGEENLPGSTTIREAAWIEVVPGDSDLELQQALEEQLDKGEAAAIALAQSVEADLLLIHERQGRRVPGEAGEAVRESVGDAEVNHDDPPARQLTGEGEANQKVARLLRRDGPLLLNRFRAHGQISAAGGEGFNNKAKLTTRKAYGYRFYRCLAIALNHALGQLPEPRISHRFC